MKRALVTAFGFIVLALLWELLARVPSLHDTLPSLGDVIAYLTAPVHRELVVNALLRTGSEAVTGLAIGGAAGILCASLGRLFPPAAPGLYALASIVNGIPIIAVAGICVLTLPRDTTPVVVAALAAAFIVFVGTTSGLSAAGPDRHDLFRAFGATSWKTFVRLEAPAAVPAILDAARSAAPASVVGAILGEWFVAEAGLGPMLIAAMQNYETIALWAVALAGALLSMLLYGAIGIVRELADRALQ